MEYLSKPCTISIITDIVVKSSLWDRIPFKVLTLAITGISALLIKYVVQKEVTEKHIAAVLTRSQKEEDEWMQIEMQTFTEWKEKEKGTFIQWVIKEKAAFIAWEEKEKKMYIEMYSQNEKHNLEESLWQYISIFDGFKREIVDELKDEQQKTLDGLQMTQMSIMEDLKQLQTSMLP